MFKRILYTIQTENQWIHKNSMVRPAGCFCMRLVETVIYTEQSLVQVIYIMLVYLCINRYLYLGIWLKVTKWKSCLGHLHGLGLI